MPVPYSPPSLCVGGGGGGGGGGGDLLTASQCMGSLSIQILSCIASKVRVIHVGAIMDTK